MYSGTSQSYRELKVVVGNQREARRYGKHHGNANAGSKYPSQ